ncbi:MAG: NAD-dependent epimerase/dehydratase family protein [Nanoarchaeota archaeon]|nr:NAD-dependent epimerase/dehydratase family protein [Nanoarchaeota archaeon]
MSCKLAITGGCGFLGQHLTKELLTKVPDAEIHLLDLRAARAPLYEFSAKSRVRTTLGLDILETPKLAEALTGADTVIHLAGLVSFSLKDKEALHRVNVEGTKSVLAAAREAGVKRLIHVSSVAALGYTDDASRPATDEFIFDWKITEKKEKHYMLTKRLADEAVQEARKNGLQATIVYPGLMFGPGDKANASRLISALKKKAIPFTLPGGTNIIDVRDVARAIRGIVQKPKEGDYLLSGRNLSFKEVNRVIATKLAVEAPKKSLPRFLNAPLFWTLLSLEKISSKKLELTADNLDSGFKFRYFDNAKALRELGWKPEISFEQTIDDTIVWMRQHDLLEE